MRDVDGHPFARLASVLAKVVRPGRFCASGHQLTPLPRVDIAGFGTLPLPLIPQVLDLLTPHSEPAPYGRGSETLVDEDVRRCRQVAASQIELSDPHWQNTLDAITAAATRDLGVEGDVEARLYKLLLYEVGDFFIPHRDSEKEPGMFGTLVVVLPSTFTGGDLRVSHRGETRTLDLRSSSPGELAWGAFYADCTHEILPITSGVRAVLVFNLVRAQGGLDAPVHDEEITEVQSLLTAWEDDEYPPKLCYLLEHHYTPAELAWSTLKGQDQGRAFVLRDAAVELGYPTQLGMVSIEQRWSAMEIPSRYRRRDTGLDIELYDLIEEDRTVEEWVDLQDDPTGAPPIPFGDDELCPPQSLEDEKPDALRYHEATGNEGATAERTYRRAAVVVWPPGHHVAVIAQGGSGAVAWALAELDPTDPGVAELARELGAAGVQGLSAGRWAMGLENLLEELARHGLADAAGQYIQRHAAEEGLREGLARPFAALLDLLDPDEAGAAAAQVVERNRQGRVSDSAALLSCLVRHSVHPRSTWVAAMEALLDLLDAEDAVNRWGRRLSLVVDRTCLAVLIPAAAMLPDQESAGRLLQITRTRSERFPFHETVLPAVLELASEGACPDCWRDHVVGVLRDHLAQPLEAPRDLRRDPPSCSCEHCQALGAFLTDPSKEVWAYKVRKEVRRHLYQTIERERLDAKATTIRTGSPYIWRCCKTTGRYEAKVAVRRREEDALSKLTGEPPRP